jgi:hypothetical protein
MSMISNLSVLTVTVLLSFWSPKHPVDLKMTAPNGVQRIDQLWLVTFVDEAGRETVVQAKLVSGEFVPLIAADAARLDSIMRQLLPKAFSSLFPFRSSQSSEWAEVVAQSARFKTLSLATSALPIW